MLKVLLPLLLVTTTLAASGTYDYSDPDSMWTGTCSTGKSQSPIDVITPSMNEAVWRDNDYYTFSMPTRVNSTFKMKSHTVFYDISGNGEVLYVEDPTSTSKQQCLIHQLHFHWGDNSSLGAEHHMDGKAYSAEIHLVTQRQGVNGTEYVVFNRFLEEGHDYNAEIGKLLYETDSPDMDLSALYPDSIDQIITYSGSLTTPTCDEVVTWVIISEPLKISSKQGELLREWTYDGKKIGDTHRPIQPLNGRTIYGVKFNNQDNGNDSDGNDKDDDKDDNKDDDKDMNGDDKDDNMEDGKCMRGYFNWEGSCNKCPPGQSTINTGSSYYDCMATRYIKCQWDESYGKMWCEQDYCPCSYMEYCSDGKCFADQYSSGLGVTASALLAMVTALYALF